MEKRNERNNLLSFKEFLSAFCENLKEKSEDIDAVPIRFHNPRVTPEEIEGECLDWVLNYLSTRDCPSVLAYHIAREVYLRVSGGNLDAFLNEKNVGEHSTDGQTQNDVEYKDTLTEYNAEELHKHVLETTDNVCRSWCKSLPEFMLSSSYHKVSFHAIKNTRRKMEDTHVMIQDINALFGLKDEPTMSFYGVFDGHAGTDASVFTAKHIHRNLVHHSCLDKNPAEALRSAFRVTDEQFIPKAKREKWRSGTTGVTCLIRDNTAYLSWLGDSQAVLVKDGRCVTHMDPHKPERQKWKSGTTGVTCLIRDNSAYLSWLGDSQAVLVKDGRCVTHMDPHKPERQDERDRIESQGGFVMMVGDLWRVGGNIAVSRAIGDVAYKPFISSEAEVTTVELDGTEDYVVLACDGLWDVVMEEDLPKLVYNFLVEAEGDQSNIAKSLVQYAKDNDSLDNISVVIVFFRETVSEPKSDTGMFNFLLDGSSQGADQSGKGKGEKGDNSKDSDSNQGKGGNSNDSNDSQGKGNKAQDSSDLQEKCETDNYLHESNQSDINQHGRENDQSSKDKSNVIQSKRLNSNQETNQHYSEHLGKVSQLESGGEMYVKIGHILGLESPESTEFLNNDDNQMVPDYESQDNVMPEYEESQETEESPLEKEVDLDYYGVFNTRLVDGPIDLSSLDDQNSSILLKDIADSMYNRKYADSGEQVMPEHMEPYEKTQQKALHRIINNTQANERSYNNNQRNKGPQKNKKGVSNSPICWAFTGKNKATVQNHRLNLAAKGMVKGSNPTPGERRLAAKAPHHLPERKFAQLSVSKENIMNTSSNFTNFALPKKDSIKEPVQAHSKPKSQKVVDSRPGFTVFGSKASCQPEAQKFYPSWRPRKPLKPLSTVIHEMPPTPFTNKQLGK